MTRDEMEAKARELGIGFNSRTSDEVLRQRIDTAILSAADPEDTAEVKVIVPNLWTSKGKFFKLDSVELPRAEAEWLQGRDQVVIK